MTQYSSPFGLERFPRDSPAWMKAVLRMNFILPHVLPDDSTALMELASAVGACAGGELRPMDALMLFMGHAIKWPGSVRHFTGMVTASRPESAVDLAAMY